MRRKLCSTFLRSEIPIFKSSTVREALGTRGRARKRHKRQRNKQTDVVKQHTYNGWHSNYNPDEVSLQHGCEMKTFCFVLLSILAICLSSNTVEGKETLFLTSRSKS